jgi:hypothetical protein
MTVCAIAALFWPGGRTPILWKEWLYVPLYVLQAVSLFGFVYSRRIAAQVTWKTVFVASVAYEILNAYEMATDWGLSASSVDISFVLAIAYLIQIPLWYGNFLYGFRCKELWGKNA